MSTSRKTKAHCYELVKFFADGRPPERVRDRLTESQAIAACNSPTTRCPDEWFINYRRMVEFRPNVRLQPSITSALIACHNGLGARRTSDEMIVVAALR